MTIHYQFVEPHLYNDQRPYLEGRAEAWDGPNRVGYVKWECLSSEYLNICFPTIWHYANEMTGWCLGINRESDLSDQQTLDRVIRGVCAYSWSLRDVDVSTLTLQEKWSFLERHSGDLAERFKEYKKRLDYCFVAFSRVQDGVRIFEPDLPNYQRQGIGTRLYKLTAMWLAVHRQTAFHSSSLVSDSAKAVWQKMVDMGAPIYKRLRPDGKEWVYALDYTQTPVLRAQAQSVVNSLPTIPQEKQTRVA